MSDWLLAMPWEASLDRRCHPSVFSVTSTGLSRDSPEWQLLTQESLFDSKACLYFLALFKARSRVLIYYI